MAHGSEITLLGFGCRQDASPGFGLLAEGTTNTSDVTAEFIETRAGSALCTGDSGGGAYLATGAFAKRRRIVALNHASDGYRSLLSRVANPQFQTWAAQWSAAKGVRLCGLDPAAADCRP